MIKIKNSFITNTSSLLVEFGSRQFSHPRRAPYSPSLSHYLSAIDDINYVCFDPWTDKNLFVKSMDVIDKTLFYDFYGTIIPIFKKKKYL